jgi:capsule polysaccharide modification protein KpsS
MYLKARGLGLQVKVCRAYGQYATGMNLREINAGCEILCSMLFFAFYTILYVLQSFLVTPGRFKHYVTSRIVYLSFTYTIHIIFRLN